MIITLTQSAFQNVVERIAVDANTAVTVYGSPCSFPAPNRPRSLTSCGSCSAVFPPPGL